MSGRLFRVEHVDADDTGDLQTTTLLGPMGETLKKVHRVQPFGFHSNVPKGAHGMALQFGGGPDGGRLLNAVLGLEHQDYRPRKREVGSTALYDQNGSLVSLVMKEVRIVHAKSITLVAPEIVLEGTVKLGGADADKPASMKGSLDTKGDVQTGNLATKVLVK